MRCYIGVDYSTRKLATAQLFDNDDNPIVLSAEYPRSKYPDRIYALTEIHYDFASLLGDLPQADKTHIAIEAPILGMSRDVQTAMWMSMTTGALVIAASDYGYSPMLVPPATWKKRICGRGNLDKAGVAMWMRDTYPALDRHCHNDDEHDALCLALYAESIDKEIGDDSQEAEKAAVGQQHGDRQG